MAFALHGVAVPRHVPESLQEHPLDKLQVALVVLLEHKVGEPEQVPEPGSQEHPAALQVVPSA